MIVKREAKGDGGDVEVEDVEISAVDVEDLIHAYRDHEGPLQVALPREVRYCTPFGFYVRRAQQWAPVKSG